ncbi:mitochondrial lysine-tRNA synthetase [Elasticomyces elasticus]|nr:mitochondrial lysine-tRNA synthetase [Elasticomyces elasticus]KAK3620502.1 mitochondrial lysine-tRNA synthetase [Elasticomyces elasticus]KAK4904064.1 mitochondrial lysine-tRNA synthetase [Elasticomyces elasticus]KAK5768083.1 mitochondrial lysine-tRNA synthetase [Elasticomyces elasticus]
MIADETLREAPPVTVAGRVQSVRTAGSKLVFMDISDGTANLQTVSKISELQEESDKFKGFTKTARKGDWYSVTGWPHKTSRGELSILATKVPQLLSPSLHQIPETLEDLATRAHSRHVDMLVNPQTLLPLLVRHNIEREFRNFFDDQGFVQVSTPLLTAGAGGAVARPFETMATELEGQKLNLRIAPELWLKRLVIGGMHKVYEIGPAFRNEGVDATHNPEFSICEFYDAFATLEDLIQRTEALLFRLETTFDSLRREDKIRGLPESPLSMSGPYPRLQFIPTLEREMGCSLPNLSSNDATEQLLPIFHDKQITVPASPTLPRLLDALAGEYLEPLCQNPTFITNHPAALSPLSKHFTCATTSQTVAARAELFIQGREYANMYEEENSPIAQRRNFETQLRYRAIDGEGDGRGEVDESYLEALEWGLPPTGGWGCGMDRLVMLFSGRERIGDVLAFGGLRNVVAAGKRGRV